MKAYYNYECGAGKERVHTVVGGVASENPSQLAFFEKSDSNFP